MADDATDDSATDNTGCTASCQHSTAKCAGTGSDGSALPLR